MQPPLPSHHCELSGTICGNVPAVLPPANVRAQRVTDDPLPDQDRCLARKPSFSSSYFELKTRFLLQPLEKILLFWPFHPPQQHRIDELK